MRAALVCFAFSSFAAFAACASSEDEALLSVVEPDAALPADAGVPEVDANDPVAEGPECSPAGWCATALPDVDLVLRDVWPLASGTAFALAESPTLGVKVLAWDPVASTWSYIDDGAQNDPGIGKYAANIWAPNDTELYYAVGPGVVFHGTRSAPSETTWTWSHSRLANKSLDGDANHDANHDHGHPVYAALSESYPSLGVWGTNKDDVYAWYANAIYRWKEDDGGAPSWVPEYVADDRDDPSEHFYFLSAAGADREDVWFSGARDRASSGACAVVVRKTATGYARTFDGTVSGGCGERAGTTRVSASSGWLTDLHAIGGDQFIGLVAGREVVRLTASSTGNSVLVAKVPTSQTANPLNSLWPATGEQVWLSGRGLVIESSNTFADGGTFKLSTISLSGAPLTRPMHQIRGTSNTNLWTVGVRYALHKTTP